MKKNTEPTRRVPIYFPLSLLAKLQDSNSHNRRSFTQEVVWRLEQSYASSNDESKVVVAK